MEGLCLIFRQKEQMEKILFRQHIYYTEYIYSAEKINRVPKIWTLRYAFNSALFKVPIEKLKTCRAEIRSLEVRIFNSGGGIHYTAPIPAVGEAEAVSQFV